MKEERKRMAECLKKAYDATRANCDQNYPLAAIPEMSASMYEEMLKYYNKEIGPYEPGGHRYKCSMSEFLAKLFKQADGKTITNKDALQDVSRQCRRFALRKIEKMLRRGQYPDMQNILEQGNNL